VLAGISEFDMRTVWGKTLSRIADETGVPAVWLTPSLVKSRMNYFRVPEDQAWRVPMVKELLDDNITIPGFSDSELRTMLWNLGTMFPENI
jgi:hypothetical protein